MVIHFGEIKLNLYLTIYKNKLYIKGLNKKFCSKCKRIYTHSWGERDLNHDCKSTKRFICMKPNFWMKKKIHYIYSAFGKNICNSEEGQSWSVSWSNYLDLDKKSAYSKQYKNHEQREWGSKFKWAKTCKKMLTLMNRGMQIKVLI